MGYLHLFVETDRKGNKRLSSYRDRWMQTKSMIAFCLSTSLSQVDGEAIIISNGTFVYLNCCSSVLELVNVSDLILYDRPTHHVPDD